MMQEFTVS